jgi:ferredoxin
MTDASNVLHRIAVSWPVVLATRERLDFWQFLQENTGINNYHVSLATRALRESLEEKFQALLEETKQVYEAKIEQAKMEEASQVMEKLTSVLMGLDLNSVGTIGSRMAANEIKTDTTKEVVEEQELPEVPEVETTVVLSEDPYIDTPLCTSCNECIQRNRELFKYNEDKMAYIADPKAGSFLDLVEAAELCPVNIIHPGAPLDKSEANLDELIERAAKFQ